MNSIEFFPVEKLNVENYSPPAVHATSRIPQSSLLDPAKDVCINQQIQISQILRLPLFSISRGKASIRIHAILRLLVEFFDPSLSAHLASLLPSWWRPYCYPVELQEDFISVGYYTGLIIFRNLY